MVILFEILLYVLAYVMMHCNAEYVENLFSKLWEICGLSVKCKEVY